MKVRVADYIAGHLRAIGVDAVFMLSGGGMMHLIDAVGRTEGLRVVCHHHEQCAAMAADGYARRSGRLGVCYATSGPGATNLLTGVVGAWQDNSPVLFVTGQSKSTQTIHGSGIAGLRQFGTFEVDIVPMMASATKYAVMVTDPASIRYHLEKAIHLATTGRPGAVLLDLPLDVQGARVDPAELVGFVPSDAPPRPAPAEVHAVITALRTAKRPLLLAGSGVRAGGAAELFRAWVDQLGVPVATTQFGKDVLPYDHPLFVGHPGPKGDRAGNFAVQTADLIVSVGCSLHAQTTGWESELFATNAVKIQVDVDRAVLAREQVRVGVKIVADVRAFIEDLGGVSVDVARWKRTCADWKVRFASPAEPHVRGEVINYYDVIEALGAAAPADACVISDAGSGFYTIGQAFPVKDGQRVLSSGSLGAMGFALPAANGAAMLPGGPVICVTGDGSLMTNVHDLAVTALHGRNVKLFVVNNDGYVSIRNTQRDFCGGLYVGTDPASGVFIPALEDLARTYRLPYLRCERPADLAATVAAALATGGPVLVEIVAMRDQRIIPSVQSVKLPDGRMVSKPLHDMFPYLGDEAVAAEIAAAMAD